MLHTPSAFSESALLFSGATGCVLRNASALAAWWTARGVSAPSGASGWSGVHLSSAHGGVSSGGSFYYHAEVQASGAAPPLGPERGGTRVAVLGSGLKDAYTLRCRFANASSAALAAGACVWSAVETTTASICLCSASSILR